jgi:hypothetical protein
MGGTQLRNFSIAWNEHSGKAFSFNRIGRVISLNGLTEQRKHNISLGNRCELWGNGRSGTRRHTINGILEWGQHNIQSDIIYFPIVASLIVGLRSEVSREFMYCIVSVFLISRGMQARRSVSWRVVNL